MLSFYILWVLSKKPMNGQEIAEELGKRRGAKPTAGTLYPALKELRKKGLIEMERKGRATNYSLTKSGREEMEKACEYFCGAFGEIVHEYEEKQ